MLIPLSIAAWRTVLPFSTVTGCPSIVSVTVSITPRSYILLVDLDERRVVGVGGHRPHRSVQRDRTFRVLVGEDEEDVFRRAARIRDRDRDGHVDRLPVLVEVDHGFAPVHVIAELHTRDLGAEHPRVEETTQIAPARLLHGVAEVVGAR